MEVDVKERKSRYNLQIQYKQIPFEQIGTLLAFEFRVYPEPWFPNNPNFSNSNKINHDQIAENNLFYALFSVTAMKVYQSKEKNNSDDEDNKHSILIHFFCRFLL
jgi:hypothetical protein